MVKALLRISASSIDRLLKPARVHYRGRGRSTTKPGTLLHKQIPIKTNQWDETRPGFLEADTVAHCGDSTDGQYANTIDTVDIATGWTEQRAVWGKGEAGVLEQIKDIENTLPFILLGFDSDNGNEFLNHHLFRHFAKRKEPIQFTRSRAYHKDDNAHIEQKNWTHVRLWFGYHRIENPKAIPLMNELYKSDAWRFYHNFFLPSVKLIEKKELLQRLSSFMISLRLLTKGLWNLRILQLLLKILSKNNMKLLTLLDSEKKLNQNLRKYLPYVILKTVKANALLR